jgi:SAM-dependent methyltransferase/uncharacterized protein YbaR (Trm112 family)
MKQERPASSVAEPGRAPAALGPRLLAVAARLRCPECARGVVAAGSLPGTLVCARCGAAYPIRAGVPVLLSELSRRELRNDLSSRTGERMVAEYGAAAQARAARPEPHRRWIDMLRPPDVMHHTNPGMRREATRRLFDHCGPRTLVLNVGGGPTRYSDIELTMNLEAFHNVDLVGDAHNVPFLDDTFDSIVCNAVLEHVRDPEKVVSEMLRVLKPGSYLYAEVPYIFFFHGYPNDYRRYTREGVRRLFSALDSPEIGIAIGPVSALLQSANMLVEMLVPARVPGLRRIVNGCFRWATFALKYLDIPLVRREAAHVLAGGFWVLGRKPLPGDRSNPAAAAATP